MEWITIVALTVGGLVLIWMLLKVRKEAKELNIKNKK